ncbi:MAG: hypothetical protein ABSF26_21220 [Thermoguttaceae bacterium]
MSASYTITELGAGSASGINDSGQVAISSGDVFVYSNGTMKDLGVSFGATGINESGEVVGTKYANGEHYGVLYSNGTMTYMGCFPGTYSSDTEAYGINDSGQAVGLCVTDSGYYDHAFLYTNGGMTDLGTLVPGGQQSEAWGINNSGQVVGWSDTASGLCHAFLYSNGGMTDVGAPPGFDQTQATAINDSGQIVSVAYDASGYEHAFLYSSGTWTDLGTLPGYTEMWPTAINDSGQVVGGAYTASGATGPEHAFLYSNGTLTDLGTPSGDDRSCATGINNSGQIVGYASSFSSVAVLWSPSSAITSFTPPAAIEGKAVTNAVVAAFTDANPHNPTATITWADGTNSAGKILKNADGSYTVEGSHTYDEAIPAPGKSFTVSVSDTGLNDSKTVNATVADALLHLNPVANPIVITGLTPPAATEGKAITNQVVATFTDSNSAANPTATITWADGTQTSGTILPGGGGGFAVQGSYTYAQVIGSPGGWFYVTVQDQKGASCTACVQGVTVADAAVKITSVTPPQGASGGPVTEGQLISNAVVAYFTDDDPKSVAANFTATITWADGQQTPGTVVASTSSGGFQVKDTTYDYAEEIPPSGGSFTVTVKDNGGASDSMTVQGVKVADAPLTIAGVTPPPSTEGVVIPYTIVAHFTDADPLARDTSNYTAQITWADGNQTQGLIAPGFQGGLDVCSPIGGYTYAEQILSPGRPFTVKVWDGKPDNSWAASASMTVSSTVADAPLTAGAMTPPAATEGKALGKVPLFHFTDADPNAPVTDYTATITWGDGSTSTVNSNTGAAGQIVAGAKDGFDVLGSHTYAKLLANATFTVKVVDVGGSSVSATSGFGVGDAPLTAGALTPPKAKQGKAFSKALLFHFTDGNPKPSLTDYTATIAWGDGARSTVTSTAGSAGQIVADAKGGCDVLGSYTYVQALSNATFSVQVTDAGGQQASASQNNFSVAAAKTSGGGSIAAASAVQVVSPALGAARDGVEAGSAATPVFPAVASATNGAAFQLAWAMVGVPLTNAVLAHFTDDDPNGKVTDYQATITWGDGNNSTVSSSATSDGQIVANGKGGFDVLGSHTYTQPLDNATLGVAVAETDNVDASKVPTSTTICVVAAPVTLVSVTPPATASPVTEAKAFSNAVVAHFTCVDPSASPGDFTVTIAWGDGSSSAGQVVAGASGGFDVQGSHTYQEDISKPGGLLTVTVTAPGGASATKTASGVSVDDAALTPGAFTPPKAVEGQLFQGIVFRFTDANPDAQPEDFTATITWGDETGLSKGQTVTYVNNRNPDGSYSAIASGFISPDSAGGFDVWGAHTYADEILPSTTFKVEVKDAGGKTISQSGVVTVADALLTAGAFTPPKATEGTALSKVVLFHFTDANPKAAASDFAAVIAWGDGSSDRVTSSATAAGSIVANAAGGFDVQGSHTYAEELSGATLAVGVTDVGGSVVSARTTTLSVADAPLKAGALTPPKASEGKPLSDALLFHFTDADPKAPITDYTATINWGDGTPPSIVTSAASSAGQIVANAKGGFDVLGSHAYADELGGATFGVQVSDVGGANVGAQITTFSVTDAALKAGALTPPKATAGKPLSKVLLFRFSDADPKPSLTDYAATITWGDGSTSVVTSASGSAGQIVADAKGGFDVLGSHTYAAALNSAFFSVQVVDAGGQQASAFKSTFSVAAGPLSQSQSAAAVSTPSTAKTASAGHSVAAQDAALMAVLADSGSGTTDIGTKKGPSLCLLLSTL